ncbi:hypothetical protein ACQ4PT_053543 [Festuca glaucescens]
MIEDHAAGSCKRRRVGSTDDYELTRVLGKGGFGVVVKARHRGTGIDVALKFHLRRSPARAGCKERSRHSHVVLHRELMREACYLAACRGHPSVVGFHSSTASRGTRARASAASSWSTSAPASRTSCADGANRSRRRRRGA